MAGASAAADCSILTSGNGRLSRPDKQGHSQSQSQPPQPPSPPTPDDGQMTTSTMTTTASTVRTVSGGSSTSTNSNSNNNNNNNSTSSRHDAAAATIKTTAVTALPAVPADSGSGSGSVPVSPNNSNRQTPSALSVPVPRIKLERPQSRLKSKRSKQRIDTAADTADTPSTEFQGLSLNLDADSGFAEEFKNDEMIKFSNRGSLLINGQLARENSNASLSLPRQQQQQADSRQDAASTASARTAATASTSAPPRQSIEQQSMARSGPRLTVEEEGLSEKVRTYYAMGTDKAFDTEPANTVANKIGNRWHDSLGARTDGSSLTTSASPHASTVEVSDLPADGKANSQRSTRSFGPQRAEHELAGGIEYWADIDNDNVDRYGFIIPKQDSISTDGVKEYLRTRPKSASLHATGEHPRRRSAFRRSLRRSTSNGALSPGSGGIGAAPASRSQTSSLRPRSSPGEGGRQGSGVLGKHLSFRSRNQRVMENAGDMLTLPSTATHQAISSGLSSSEDVRARRKETEREEKWRKMARPVAAGTTNGGIGGGMSFEFDTTSPKLIERTWKGVPDKWRATAWHAFLTASAVKRPGSLPDEQLVRLFEEYQTMSSPDDVQIDIDVPRTISSHIMFRRRYRGGQRLLFHVLHAMSLHFSETRYVQGMAALAATLLAYYEEEKAFVMLVRLWELRGLDKLYKSGFGGLMAALDDFERDWLSDGELAKKLSSLNIVPTAYGTRWYLTLFNYSIPFPAQLRVWDVFMLLGGGDHDDEAGRDATSKQADGNRDHQFGTTLDVLHAASAALIDGMRDTLLESEFENCMTLLTSWIPIKDEDVFMRVAKAEWTAHRARMRQR